MHYWEYIFFISCFIVFYNYAGYAIIALVLNKIKKLFTTPPESSAAPLPGVSFIVAAFNEEDFIEQKIGNSLGQDYPPEMIEFIFVTDGSTDKTPGIVRQYPAIRLLHEDQRNGKSAAMNRAALSATRDILIFSDANTTLNITATRNIARHYHDIKVGGIAGEKKVIPPAGSPHEVGAGEGLYWKYESFLKKVDSDFYSVVGAAGELFSIRRELFEPLPHTVILDDFVISLKLTAKGYRVLYEPDAYAMETPSFSLTDENKRKIRIAAGGFQAMGMLSSLLLFWRHPALSFLYISHRVLRWTLSPLCFILALLSNIALACHPGGIYRLFLAAQLLFYGLAIAGQFAGPRLSRLKMLKLPSYFVFMNVSVIQGFFRFLKGRQTVNWEKARRSMPSTHQPRNFL
jgi:cellulose synthase/poly-beta-1,6-N-acetylglucosamine synthase-like glycosyltransferase